MNLTGNFFSINDLSQSDGLVKAMLLLVDDHPIYSGHFPGHPVFPGALMMQTILEIFGEARKTNLYLQTAESIKFLTVLDPREHKQIEVEIKYSVVGENLLTDARLFAGPVIFFKLKAVLKSA